MAPLSALHAHTPGLTVVEPRGLPVRAVSFHRRQIDEPLSERIDRSVYDGAGRRTAVWDPRLWAANAPPNVARVFSLSGQTLLNDSVDAGWTVQLLGENGLARCRWDANGHSQRVDHDELSRPVAVFESDGTYEMCVERMTYAGPEAHPANQAGRLIRHDDPAGTLLNATFDLRGNLTRQMRRFVSGEDPPDWPEPPEARDLFIEPGDGAQTAWRFAPTGEVIEQFDAVGNRRLSRQTVAGLLKQSSVQLPGKPSLTLVSDIRYDAHSRVVSEAAGNGVVSWALYAEDDGRLLQLKASRPHGERLQDLQYGYDPVGNVVSVEDASVAVTHFINRRIEPISTFTYDTLYRLMDATGYELAAINRGPDLAGFQCPVDSSRLTDYRQTFEYDAGGNLLKLSHVGTQNHSQRLMAAKCSNRCLTLLNDVPPTEAVIAEAFDACGNMLQLAPGQKLEWDVRHQLRKVTPVARESEQDDSEIYVYDSGGQRVRKLRTTQARSLQHKEEARYLPGLEIRTNTARDEELHVMTIPTARNEVRILHWQRGKPDVVENDQVRLHLTNHLGSATLELDGQGQLISQETYYPFGGTSWWAGRSQIETHYRTVRYSGKERDATGLYYYGMRYYAPWLMRWLNPDPAGWIDGPNHYRFVRNNPLTFKDPSGASPTHASSNAETAAVAVYDQMFTGWIWKGLQLPGEGGLDTIRRLSERNIRSMQSELDSEREKIVAARIANLSPETVWITHFSNKDFTTAQGVDILSLQGVQRLSTGGELKNSALDVDRFGTTDFAFFSLEAGGSGPRKPTSRFGDYRYHAAMASLGNKHEFSHVQMQDLFELKERQISKERAQKLSWLANEVDTDQKFEDFWSRDGLAPNEEVDLLYLGNDMLKGIGLRTALDLRGMSDRTRTAVVEWSAGDRSAENLSEVVNALYRPQVLVPGGLVLGAGKFGLKKGRFELKTLSRT
ncbi:RHS repeat domain-containing protein [Pseudomonas sp. NFR16]|uniref:RHS repeat domain-containing protein n=1 Tax=Pseudomonas sp. NFR16 TaxID=1566248 RepID=UPI0008C70757|nr:RHS repeat-associated core domain-containing protein [Pseudomonas sp. NFR16]SEJ18250.1 insecticidal toxin complex protein TccC [Pseudomonas sp. NFR16]